MTPGSNLLKKAMRLIGSQTVTYFRNTGRTTSATGRDVPEYAAPVEVSSGSVQPVDSARYAEMGLDVERVYVTWYVPADVFGVGRDASGDVIEWMGGRYQCQHGTDWYGQDGWKSIVCVRVN
jgi:hypothetical protein